MKKINNYALELFLGVGLGLGFLTSFRFLGPVGLPEIFILSALLILIKRDPMFLFKFKMDREGLFKIFIVIFTFFVMPIATCIIYFLTDLSGGSTPQYVISYMLGVSLMFYLAAAIKNNKINMNLVVILFWFSFVIANFLGFYIFGLNMDADEGLRYSGGASNPNQLSFYAATLSLLSVVFFKKLSILLIPVIIFFVSKSNSDAYNLMLFSIFFTYFFLVVFYPNKKYFKIKISILFISCFILSVILVYEFGSVMNDIWLAADEGNVRISLFENAWNAITYSPIFGFGAGTFSGVNNPFENMEAHNTFLDFSMQFGVIYSVMIYWVIISSLIVTLRENKKIISSFLIGFLISGLFHFSGRHFVFWVEMAVLCNYAFRFNKNQKSAS